MRIVLLAALFLSACQTNPATFAPRFDAVSRQAIPAITLLTIRF